MESDRWYLCAIDCGVLQGIVDLGRVLSQLIQITPKGRRQYPALGHDLGHDLFTQFSPRGRKPKGSRGIGGSSPWGYPRPDPTLSPRLALSHWQSPDGHPGVSGGGVTGSGPEWW